MANDELVQHSIELLQPLGSVRSRRMFGGHGLYVDDLFVALVLFDRLFLKADDHTRETFQSAGCEPFVYDGAGKKVTVSYFTVPPDAMESPALMLPWGRLALAAAVRSRAKKRPVQATPRKPTSAGSRSKPTAGRRG